VRLVVVVVVVVVVKAPRQQMIFHLNLKQSRDEGLQGEPGPPRWGRGNGIKI